MASFAVVIFHNGVFLFKMPYGHSGAAGTIISRTKRGDAYESGMVLLLQIDLTAALIMDIRTGRINNRFLMCSLTAGLLLQIFVCGEAWYTVTGRALLPVLLFWLPFRMHALGAGDIKLFSVVGCFWTLQGLFSCILLSFAAGAVFALIRLLIRRELLKSFFLFFNYFQKTCKNRQIEKYPGRDLEGHQMHFSAAVYIGFLVSLGVLYGESVRCFM